MGMMAEFKEFAMKGNVMDLAVGVIIGGAFGKIVDSLVGDVIMPVISAIMGGRFDFANLYVALGKVPEGTAMTLDAVKKAGVPVFAYGNFITILINFIILAFVIFLMVKMMNRWKEQPAPAATPAQEVLLGEIRDLLRNRPA
ncbi:MAG TPA: large conductance mechanosensitive channel protein MscL [Burkholderiaceae bacterium]|jgi:large conductance mechanosensitive channel|nr:large conductance mechanosensitive channel protein MscL [Burkholderiaceae bacterium]